MHLCTNVRLFLRFCVLVLVCLRENVHVERACVHLCVSAYHNVFALGIQQLLNHMQPLGSVFLCLRVCAGVLSVRVCECMCLCQCAVRVLVR